MEFLSFLLIAMIVLTVYKSREQGARVALLASYLGKYQIERQMQSLIDGYMRWLGEQDPDRQRQLRGMLDGLEQSLSGQFEAFAADVAGMSAPLAQVNKLPFWIPFAQQLLPGYRLFDVRRAFAIHASGIAGVVANVAGRAPRDQAFTMTAELLLMQHTCHWFCRSKTVASARLVVQHQTPYEQVLRSVSPQTARDYRELVGS